MFGLGIWELLIILGIVVLLFGAKRLPMVGEGVGKMINNFKKENKKTASIEHQEEADGSKKETSSATENS